MPLDVGRHASGLVASPSWPLASSPRVLQSRSRPPDDEFNWPRRTTRSACDRVPVGFRLQVPVPRVSHADARMQNPLLLPSVMALSLILAPKSSVSSMYTWVAFGIA